MTTKILNGAYPSGSTLNSSYTGVSITRYADLQGTGLATTAPATVTNAGTFSATSGYGGAGINLAFGGVVTNSGGGRGGRGEAAIPTAGQPGHRLETAYVNSGTLTGSAGAQGNQYYIYQGAIMLGCGGPGGAGGTALSYGGAVTNTNTGVITGGRGGNGGNAYSDYSNIPPILPGSDGRGGGGGIGVQANGVVTNAGHITGGAGGYSGQGSYGSYGGAGAAAVFLGSGGGLVNSGTIDGGHGGGAVYSRAAGAGGAGVDLAVTGSINNSGAITGGAGGYAADGSAGIAGDGIDLTAGGVVINGSTASTAALISGHVGVYAGPSGAATVTNYGTIEGTGGVAVQFNSSTDRLIAEVGSTWVGAVQGGSGTLELAGGTGTITGLGATGTLSGAEAMTFSGFGAYVLDSGNWVLAGASQLGAGQSLQNNADLVAHGSLVNLGSIVGVSTYAGVRVYGGLTNGSAVDTSALIESRHVGVYLTAGQMASNFGTISGLGAISTGVSAGAGATVVNAGLVQGGSGGASYGGSGVVLTGTATVTNTGAILGGSGGAGFGGACGIELQAGGTVTNGGVGDSSALIAGVRGLYAHTAGAATVTNFGTIDGTAGVSVQFNSASDRLIAEAGSTFIGAVKGGGGTLELAKAVGTITGLGATGTISGAEAMTFSGFGSYVLAHVGSWTLTGTNTLAAGQSLTIASVLTNTGTLIAAAGATIRLAAGDMIGGTLQSSGTGKVLVSGAGNTLDGTASMVTNQASLTIANKAALTIQGAIANSGKISLAAKTATTSLIVGSVGATLSGHGSVILGNNALNTITGAATTATLTNVDNKILGSGLLGSGKMTLVNQTKGVIDATGTVALTIDTGTNTITNAGVIEAVGTGVAVIASAVNNIGLLETLGGNLTVNGAVTGTGRAAIKGGTLDFTSTFTENVSFTGTTGVLELANSQTYKGRISGFSTTGGTLLDLRDVGFVSSTEATFSGTATGGTLTVTDGTHTAKIKLTGNYLNSGWVASSDNNGGVIVVDPPKAAATAAPLASLPPAHQFIAAMAGMGASSASVSSPISHAWREPPPVLTAPRTQMA